MSEFAKINPREIKKFKFIHEVNSQYIRETIKLLLYVVRLFVTNMCKNLKFSESQLKV